MRFSHHRASAIVVLFLLSVSAAPVAHSAEQPWRPLLPERWLGFVVASDLGQAERRLARTLDDLSYTYTSPVAAIAEALGAPELKFGEGATLVGLAGFADQNGSYPFALLPTASFQELVAELGGELTGDIGVATVLDVDLCLAPCGDWTLVTSLDRIEQAQRVMKRGPVKYIADAESPELTVEVSKAGFRFLQQRAKEIRPRVRERALRNAVLWPPPVESIDAAWAQNVPLLGMLSRRSESFRIELQLKEDGAAAIRALIHSPEPFNTPSEQPSATFPEELLGNALLRVQGSGRGPVAEALTPLYLAYSEGRPDELEADRYEPQAYARFAALAPAVMRQVLGFDALTLSRQQINDPLYSNQAVLLTLEDYQIFQSALTNATEAWNKVVELSESRTDLRFQTRQIEQPGVVGLEFDVDMVEAFDAGGSVEVKRLMRSFFGGEGHYTWRLIKLEEPHALMTDLPWDEAQQLLEQLRKAPPAPASIPSSALWRGTLRPLKYAAWQDRIAALVLGRRLPKIDPAAPTPVIDLRAHTENHLLVIEAAAPRLTLQAIGKRIEATRVER